MSLNTQEGGLRAAKGMFFSAVLFGFVTLVGCGSSEQATNKENENQDALSSFVGDKKPEASAAEKQAEELKLENTSLKQKLVKLEQDNRTMTERISDVESKLAAEREKSERAVEAARTAARSAAGITASSDPMTAYEQGLSAFNAKKYDDAIRIFDGLLGRGVTDILADNCHYWIGESYFGKRQFNESMKHLETVFNYKGSEKAGDAQFMLARCYERLGKKDEAKQAYEKVVTDYPTTARAAVARERLAKK